MAPGTYEYTFLVDRGLGYDIQKYVLAAFKIELHCKK